MLLSAELCHDPETGIKGLMAPITDQPGYTRAAFCSIGAIELKLISSPSPITLPLLKRSWPGATALDGCEASRTLPERGLEQASAETFRNLDVL